MDSLEYCSKLISELYFVKEDSEMEALLKEVENINNPVFLYPLYDNYKRNKEETYSFYFIDILGKIDSEEVIPLAVKIATDVATNNLDISYVLNIFKRKKYFEKEAIDIAFKCLDSSIKDEDICDFYSVIDFLIEAQMKEEIKSYLELIYQSNKFDIEDRKYAFGQWLTINPDLHLQYIVDIYDNIKEDEKYELVIANEIQSWHGSKIEKLKLIILEKGGVKAKGVVRRSYNKHLVGEIVKLRGDINNLSKNHKNIDFELFSQTIPSLEIRAINNKSTFIEACINFRTIINALSKNFKKHNLSLEKMRESLPNVLDSDFDKPINKIFFFLYSKNFEVDKDLFGYRKLNQLLAKIGAHPEQTKAYINGLGESKISEYYEKENWAFLYREMLLQYRSALKKLLKVIDQK